MKSEFAPWFDLPFDTVSLGCESGHVIGLRFALAARGGDAAIAEMARMFSEKALAAVDAHFLLASSMMSGEAHLAPGRAVALYRDRVQANHRRLTKAL
jgi:hypothetical protein